MGLNIPAGVRVYGGNLIDEEYLTPVFERPNWYEFPWDDWIKPQIDFVDSIGGNLIRAISEPYHVIEELLSEATYLARWEQFIAYCASLGMYVYPVGIATKYSVLTIAEIQSVLVPWAAMLEAQNALYNNIIGIDICNEATSALSNVTTEDIATLRTAMLEETDLPLSVSDHETSQSSGHIWTMGEDYQDYIDAGLCDFLDFHNYGTSGLDASALRYIAANNPTKDILVGEFGSPQSAGDALQQAYVERSLRIAAHKRCKGVAFWSIFDYVYDGELYGFQDEPGGTPRPELVDTWEDELAVLKQANI